VTQATYLAILLGVVGLLVTERLRKDLVALLALLALYATGLLTARQAVGGFSSEPALAICAVFVLCAALAATGLSGALGRGVARVAGPPGSGPTRNLLGVLPCVSALAAFEHHVTITAILLEPLRKLAERGGYPPSKLLLPLSIAASLGTTITILGAPAFLVAGELLRRAGRPGLAVFSIAPLGIPLALAGVVYLVLLGRFVLPSRRPAAREAGVLVPAEAPLGRKAWIAGPVMLFAILAAATERATLEMALLGGAAAVVLLGCLSPRQAYRSIDHRLYVFIAGAIPLGTAMDTSGTSALLAGRLHAVVAGWPVPAVLLALFWVVAVLTQFMSDAATTALLGPVAIALAAALGQAPEPFVVTVAMSAVTSFLTPLGHHGNLLVYGPGGYRFGDFFVVGAPLTGIVSVLVAVLAPAVWPD
jgi:sodium-dependent dicarboxylate transporter 2/3/5